MARDKTLPHEEVLVVNVVHNVRHPFKVNDDVIDVTAKKNGWSDFEGNIIEIDGSNIKVRYPSGTERWKMHISLRHKEKQ